MIYQSGQSTVTVKGLEPLLKFMAGAPRDLKILADRLMAEVAAKTVVKAQQIVPVRTGRLQRSITMKRNQLAQFTVGSKLFYAGFVEYGTSRQRAQPYMRPALGAVWHEVPKIAEFIFLKYYQELYGVR